MEVLRVFESPAFVTLDTALLFVTGIAGGAVVFVVLLWTGADVVFVLLGGSSSGVESAGGNGVSVERGGGTQARAVMGLAFALVTGVTPEPVPFAVAFEVAKRVASFTSWNFSINYKID